MSFGGPAIVSIASATDVALNNPAGYEALAYNDTNAKWVNSKVALGNLGGLNKSGLIIQLRAR